MQRNNLDGINIQFGFDEIINFLPFNQMLFKLWDAKSNDIFNFPHELIIIAEFFINEFKMLEIGLAEFFFCSRNATRLR